ncbi:MAG: hypothetical protein ABSE84_13455 [Isosphaeraceae bacterium]
MALVVETGLLVVTAVLPAPPSTLLRLGDREIRNCAATGALLELALLTAGVAGGFDTIDAIAGAIATEEGWGDWVTAELLEGGFGPWLAAPAGPATLAGGVEPPDWGVAVPAVAPAELEGSAELEETPGVPAGICAAPAGFNWLERVGLDGAKEADPCGFDTTWLAWLDETEPDCPGGVAACWLETVGLDGARDGTGAVVSVVPFPCMLLGERDPLVASAAAPAGCEAPLPLALDETWLADARFVSAGSAARMRD